MQKVLIEPSEKDNCLWLKVTYGRFVEDWACHIGAKAEDVDYDQAIIAFTKWALKKNKENAGCFGNPYPYLNVDIDSLEFVVVHNN